MKSAGLRSNSVLMMTSDRFESGFCSRVAAEEDGPAAAAAEAVGVGDAIWLRC